MGWPPIFRFSTTSTILSDIGYMWCFQRNTDFMETMTLIVISLKYKRNDIQNFHFICYKRINEIHFDTRRTFLEYEVHFNHCRDDFTEENKLVATFAFNRPFKKYIQKNTSLHLNPNDFILISLDISFKFCISFQWRFLLLDIGWSEPFTILRAVCWCSTIWSVERSSNLLSFKLVYIHSRLRVNLFLVECAARYGLVHRSN